MKVTMRNKTEKKHWIKKIILAFLLVTVFIYIFDFIMRPTIINTISYNAKIKINEIINSAIYKVIDDGGYKYDDLVTVSRNQSGSVMSIEANMVNINVIQSKIIKSLTDNINTLTQTKVFIPLGSLIGSKILAGSGPKIMLSYIWDGYINTQVISEFKSEGINQSLHTISIKTIANISALIPGYNVEENVSNTMAIAQTVIIGDVPESYTQIISDEENLMDDIKNTVL